MQAPRFSPFFNLKPAFVKAEDHLPNLKNNHDVTKKSSTFWKNITLAAS